MNTSAFEAVASGGDVDKPPQLDEVLTQVLDDFPALGPAIYALLQHVVRLAILVLALFLCVVLWVLVLSWLGLFWLQTRLFFATSVVIEECMDVPPHCQTDPVKSKATEQDRQGNVEPSEVMHEVSEQKHDLTDNTYISDESSYGASLGARPNGHDMTPNQSQHETPARQKEALTFNGHFEETYLFDSGRETPDAVSVSLNEPGPDETPETNEHPTQVVSTSNNGPLAQVTRFKELTKPMPQKQPALSMIEQKAQAQRNWLRDLTSCSGYGPTHGFAPHGQSRALTAQPSQTPSESHDFSAEQLAEARNFAAEATRGIVRTGRGKGHTRSSNSSAQVTPQRSPAAMLHNNIKVKVPSRATARAPNVPRTNGAVVGSSTSSLVRTADADYVPPHVRAALRAKAEKMVHGDGRSTPHPTSANNGIAANLDTVQTRTCETGSEQADDLDTAASDAGNLIIIEAECRDRFAPATDHDRSEMIEDLPEAYADPLGQAESDVPFDSSPAPMSESEQRLQETNVQQNTTYTSHAIDNGDDFQIVNTVGAHTAVADVGFGKQSSEDGLCSGNEEAGDRHDPLVELQALTPQSQLNVNSEQESSDDGIYYEHENAWLRSGHPVKSKPFTFQPVIEVVHKQQSSVDELHSEDKDVLNNRRAGPHEPQSWAAAATSIPIEQHSASTRPRSVTLKPSVAPESHSAGLEINNDSADVSLPSDSNNASEEMDLLDGDAESSQLGVTEENFAASNPVPSAEQRWPQVSQEEACAARSNTSAKKLIKGQRVAAREALREAWCERDDARSKLTGTWTFEGAASLQKTTANYMAKRQVLRKLMASGQLNEEDEKVFPPFHSLDLSAPKHRPWGVAETRARMVAAETKCSAAPVSSLNATNESDIVSTKAASMLTQRAALLAARKLRQDAIDYFKQSRPQSNISYDTWRQQGLAKLRRANAYYYSKRKAFEAALPDGWIPELLMEFPDLSDHA